MQGPAIFSRAAQPVPKVRLAATRFAPRQKKLLQGIFSLLSSNLERRLEPALAEIEKSWFHDADQARSNQVQQGLMQGVSRLRERRGAFATEFLAQLESSLARLSDTTPETQAPGAAPAHGRVELSLVETGAMDEAVVLNEIASRSEIRSSLPLFMLGQRFGVIAGKPAFEVEKLPIGPHRICMALRDATDVFEFTVTAQQDFYRQIDRHLMPVFAATYEEINAWLVREHLLPNLAYAPLRRQGTLEAKVAANAAAAPKPEQEQAKPPSNVGPHGAAARPRMPRGLPSANGGAASWMPTESAEPDNGEGRQDAELFDMLRQLLASRRQILGRLKPDAAGKARSANANANAVPVMLPQIQKSLSALQTHSSHLRMVDGKPRLRQISDLRQDLLAQFRHDLPPGADPVLPEEHGDTLDLVGMLFDQIAQEPQLSNAANTLLAKLQVPMLRVALDDRSFFTERNHPARQLLNAVADASFYWTSDDEQDRELIDKMGSIVDRLSGEYDGNPAVFSQLMGDLSQHLGTQQRKAEVSERRHVEAARGREKLEIAKLKAQEAILGQIAGRKLPRFLQSLLEQTWADVLALALLRGGEDSPTFKQYLSLSARLIDSAAAKAGGKPTLISADEASRMRADMLAALGQIGYQGDEADDLAGKLLASATPGEDAEREDPASRTELAMKLKHRARLGQAQEGAQAVEIKEVATPLNQEETAWAERIRMLPFGTWFDFTLNQQGAVARRRLSWFSTVTGKCLFVNHRGQRACDVTINWLARELARGNVKLVQAERGSIVDRAWGAIVKALKVFSGGKGESAPLATAS